jgi:hypothetical protein
MAVASSTNSKAVVRIDILLRCGNNQIAIRISYLASLGRVLHVNGKFYTLIGYAIGRSNHLMLLFTGTTFVLGKAETEVGIVAPLANFAGLRMLYLKVSLTAN